MRRTALTCLAFGALAFSDPAAAEITITQAEYAAGVLVVRGETSQANQRVTLDGRYDTRTGPNKSFRFRVRYLPRDCVIDLRAGRETRPARITNCDTMVAPPGVPPLPRAAAPRSGGAASQDGTSAADDRGSEQSFRLRVIRQPCETDKDCMVVCPERQFAVNAYCPDASARLLGERTVACPAGRNEIIAYCAAPSS